MAECELCGEFIDEETGVTCVQCGEEFLCQECYDDNGIHVCETCLVRSEMDEDIDEDEKLPGRGPKNDKFDPELDYDYEDDDDEEKERLAKSLIYDDEDEEWDDEDEFVDDDEWEEEEEEN